MNIYGKFIENKELLLLKPGETFKTEDNRIILTSNPILLLRFGWKIINYIDPSPEEGYYAKDYVWEEDENSITQVWNYQKLIITEETSSIEKTEEGELDENLPTLEERVNAIEEALLEMILND